MSVLQRRRGLTAKIWRVEEQVDGRNNKHRRAIPEDAHELRVWVFPQRSAKAEVPGQQHINVIRIGTKANLTNVDLWSRVELMGKQWDVVTPPAYHHGTRHTRHWSIDIRERP